MSTSLTVRQLQMLEALYHERLLQPDGPTGGGWVVTSRKSSPTMAALVRRGLVEKRTQRREVSFRIKPDQVDVYLRARRDSR